MAAIFVEMFSYDFILRALIVGVLVSLCSALLGVSLVLKRYSMIGDGLSHGGSDPGAHGSVTGVEEKSITLPVAKKLKDILESKGVIVAMTRTTDVDVWGSDATDVQELQARVDVAEKNKADLFISVHCNANTNKNIGGFSTYYNPKTPYDEKIAEFIQNRLLKTANLRDLGTRSANLYVNKHSSMPSTLVELLFLSNAREEKLLRSNWFQNKMAQAIADGIEDFYKQNGGVS